MTASALAALLTLGTVLGGLWLCYRWIKRRHVEAVSSSPVDSLMARAVVVGRAYPVPTIVYALSAPVALVSGVLLAAGYAGRNGSGLVLAGWLCAACAFALGMAAALLFRRAMAR